MREHARTLHRQPPERFGVLLPAVRQAAGALRTRGDTSIAADCAFPPEGRASAAGAIDRFPFGLRWSASFETVY